jgi:hypothetical protein
MVAPRDDRRRVRTFQVWGAAYPRVSVELLGASRHPLPIPFGIGVLVSLTVRAAAHIGFSWTLRDRFIVEVGADGVTLRSDRDQLFVPFRRVRAVEVERRTLPKEAPQELDCVRHLRRRGRKANDIAFAGPEETIGRIARAIRSGRAQPVHHLPVPDGRIVARDGRDTEAWLDHLLGLGAGGRGAYRDAPTSRDELWRLVETSSARPEHRAAAAVALGRLDEAGVSRLGRVARSTVSPVLREVLTACAREDPPKRPVLLRLLGEVAPI